MNRKGKLYIVAAPSGAGKTSLVNALVKKVPGICLSVSCTTREPRPGDRDGVDYHFISVEKYQKMVTENAFLEYAQVFNHHYGTGKEWVLQQIDSGIDVILEIDWQGAEQVRQLLPEHSRSIFILPPSIEALRDRLTSRQQDDIKTIEGRMAKARAEMEHWAEFDYVLVNDVFDQTLVSMEHIVLAERLQQPSQALVLADLLVELI